MALKFHDKKLQEHWEQEVAAEQRFRASPEGKRQELFGRVRMALFAAALILMPGQALLVALADIDPVRWAFWVGYACLGLGAAAYVAPDAWAAFKNQSPN